MYICDMKIINSLNINLSRTCGVYKITNTVTGQFYIGSTSQNFRARFSNHFKFFKNGKGVNKLLQTDINNVGFDNFTIEPVLVCLDDVCRIEEGKIILQELPYYNYNTPLKEFTLTTNKNKKFTKEHVEKIRKKSCEYRHTDNKDIYEKQIKLNKEGANKFEITNLLTNEIVLLNSVLELKDYFKTYDLRKYYNREYNGYYIKLVKSQKKSITLVKDNQEFSFSSFEKCDEFLNKWRGYTSKQMLKNSSKIDEYKVK